MKIFGTYSNVSVVVSQADPLSWILWKDCMSPSDA